ncbi:MAG: phosphoenolpyruvate mutase [Candidatus Aegiribacteria sp.]|nr:phosphoenolpyruvate mutase [Candidatus Aegiribacteria sp.]
MKKCAQLKSLITSSNLEFIMEAHNGVSAKIVEEAGFKGIWASGLSISAALGVRDNNEASWTQVLEVCEFMSDATSIPILLDGDTGFGNFNSFRRLVQKLEQRNIAGVCIEDKTFPKTNSFIGGEKQPLADIEEFCGKIKSGKDYQKDSDFVIVARVEAFIAGWGLNEAIKRANAYADAGADAILIHSKISSDKEIEDFMQQWQNTKPVVIVPTMYFSTPTEKFNKSGVSLVIWANHTLRASITNMQQVTKQIYTDQSLMNIEDKIVPVREIFRIQNVLEYKEAENRYLPKKESFKGLILAASKGDNFGTLTDEKPKTMIQISEETILSRIVNTLNARSIKDISVVVGFKKEAVNLPNLKYIENADYKNYGILYSLFKSLDVFTGNLIITFGDILFEEDILRKLLASDQDIVLAVDSTKYNDISKPRDLVVGSHVHSGNFGSISVCHLNEIQEVNPGIDLTKFTGEYMGLLKLNSNGSEIFRRSFEELKKNDPDFIESATLNDFFNYLIKNKQPVYIQYFKGQWKDIDSIEDLTYLVDLYTEK